MEFDKKGKPKKVKKKMEKIDHTFLFGRWKDYNIDPKKLRDELWNRKVWNE